VGQVVSDKADHAQIDPAVSIRDQCLSGLSVTQLVTLDEARDLLLSNILLGNAAGELSLSYGWGPTV
jgi:hypothetical protein